MGTYGQVQRWARLYERVTSRSSTLRGALEALVQEQHEGTDPADIEAVRAALWAVHQRPEQS